MLAFHLTWLSLLSCWRWWRIGIENLSNLSQAWWRLKWHLTMRSWPILASTERQMYLICWDICAHLPPIGRHSTSCFYWEKTHQSTWVMLMRSFGCRSRASDSTLCISASEFDNGMLAFGLMKVTISRQCLNASLVSKILSTRFALSDGLAIEKAFDKERSTKACCNWLWNFWMNLTINLNANSFDLLWHLARTTNWKMQLVSVI